MSDEENRQESAAAPEEAMLREEERKAALVKEYLEAVPEINLAALLIPPIWGPAKGIWATILWYPLWVFADNVFFAWFCERSVVTAVFAVITFVVLAGATVAFAKLSGPVAAVRAVEAGKTKEEFAATERRWAIVAVVIAVILLGFATYYNLAVRAPLAG